MRSFADWIPLMILAAFMVVVVALPFRDILDSRHFVARAESANGVVVDVVEHGGNCHPVVRFFTADEQRVADERSVQFEAEESAGDPSHFRVGDSVGVLYDPENPEYARLDAPRRPWYVRGVSSRSARRRGCRGRMVVLVDTDSGPHGRVADEVRALTGV